MTIEASVHRPTPTQVVVRRLATLSSMVGAAMLVACATGRELQVKRYHYSDIWMPVSLARGVVRTPAFAVKPEGYFIMVQAWKTPSAPPFHELVCMMAMASGPWETQYCKGEPMLKADWKVWDSSVLVAQGTSSERAHDRYENHAVYKFIGQFLGAAGKQYEVEVNFLRDGTPLNVTDPHLIVVRQAYH
jgi:hypothetical protein